MSKGRNRIVVLGAGGHAKVVLATLHEMGLKVDGIYDDDPKRKGQRILGVSVLGPISDLKSGSGYSGIVGIGDNSVRKATVARLPKMIWLNAIHPRAIIHSTVELGKGVAIFPGVVINPSVKIGNHSIINTSASVDHDGWIANFCHVGPGSHLSGATCLKEGAFMGTGSASIPGVEIGAWTTIGAGGVVTKDAPSKSTLVGIPARVIKVGKRTKSAFS